MDVTENAAVAAALGFVVQVGRRRLNVRAREADGDEREAIWKDVTAAAKDYAEYESRTTRKIPVVILERKL